jgi:hypothetical protein
MLHGGARQNGKLIFQGLALKTCIGSCKSGQVPAYASANMRDQS